MGWGKKLKLLWLGLLLVQYCNHTSHLFVYCKNLICSNERVRSDGGEARGRGKGEGQGGGARGRGKGEGQGGEARGRGYYCTPFFSESVSLVSVDC